MSELNPSWRTICAMVNSMIGGTMLTLPILFRTSGLGVGTIVLLISGFISYKTCSLYVIHMSNSQKEIEETIRRILGKKFQNFFRLITGVYLVFLNIIYVELIADQAFNIVYFILQGKHSDWITEKGEKAIIFNKISIQIVSLVFFAPLLLTLFIKNLSFLVKLTSIGVISSVSYTGFILYHFFPQISQIIPSNIPLFSWDFGNLAGTCAVAFTIHTVVNPIIKANKNQNNNLRDLKISYIAGFLIYASIGILGSIPIIGKDCDVTILNCYLKDITALIVQVLYLFMLLTVFPCFINVGRTRLLTYMYGQLQQKKIKVFNFVFMGIATFFAFFSPFLRLDLMMNIVGAFLCFFFIYYIPIMFHWKCLYKKSSNENSSIISSDNDPQASILSTEQQLTDPDTPKKCLHDYDYVQKTNTQLRLIGYGLIMVFGIAVGVYGVTRFVLDIAHMIKSK